MENKFQGAVKSIIFSHFCDNNLEFVIFGIYLEFGCEFTKQTYMLIFVHMQHSNCSFHKGVASNTRC